MGKQEFLDKVAVLFEEYCKWNGVRETAEWRLTVQYIDGKALTTMP